MATFEIPLSPTPQSLTISLAGKTYQVTVMWRDAEGGGWVLDIADAEGRPILLGVPLVTGADLLAQHEHLGFGGRLLVQSSPDADVPPTFANLGVGSRLHFVTS